MANKLNVDENLLDEEYNMLKEELKSLDELFEVSKERLDNVARVPSKANPVLLASQTANLISIKEKRINIIKELTNIKKSKMDIQMKVFNANNKLDEVESGVSKDILDIYRLLNKNDKQTLLENTIEESKEENVPQLSDNDFENILKERLKEDKEEEKKVKKEKLQELPSEYSIVVTKNKEKFIVDEDYNIIEDCDFDLNAINIVEFSENEDGEEAAFDEDGNGYEVVEI